MSVIAFHLKTKHEVCTVPSGLHSKTHFQVIVRLYYHSESKAVTSLLEMFKLSHLYREDIYFIPETMKRHHPSLPLRQDCFSAACFSLFDHKPASWKKEEGCFFLLLTRIIDVTSTHYVQENMEPAHTCHNYKNQQAYVFIWAQNCQHTHKHRAVFSFGNVCIVEV